MMKKPLCMLLIVCLLVGSFSLLAEALPMNAGTDALNALFADPAEEGYPLAVPAAAACCPRKPRR